MSEFCLEGYDLGESLGRGCTGEVFRGTDLRGRIVAIKKLDAMAVDRERLRQNVRRAVQMPSHGSLVAVRDSRLDSAPSVVISDWVSEEHSTLANLEVPFDESIAWKCIESMALGLAHLHRYGVHHGNLHPGNIFWNSSGERLQIADFGPGLAGRVHYLEIGEIAWFAPPEQLQDFKTWEDGAIEKWDVYAFGAVAYWLLEGEVPRGRSYQEERKMVVAGGSGRLIPIDVSRLGEAVNATPEVVWKKDGTEKRHDAQMRRIELRREVLEKCLSLDPRKRPVDMRDVVEAFGTIEHRIAHEEAERRVLAEHFRRDRQLRKAGLLVASLVVVLLMVTLLLLRFGMRSRGFENRTSELQLVVNHQKSLLDDIDRRRSQSEHELRTTREAANTVFSQIGKVGQQKGGTPEMGTIQHENLERSRQFFADTVAEAAGQTSRELEHSRALLHLAHVEMRLGDAESARENLQSSIAMFESILWNRGKEETVVKEVQSCLADGYEAMVGMIERDPSEEMLSTLREASSYLKLVSGWRPDDRQLFLRRLAIDFQLSRQLHDHREFSAAISGFTELGERLETQLASEPGEPSRPLLERLEEIQFHMAQSLREEGREAESARAYLAAMETLSHIAGEQAYSEEQALRLGRIYAEFGDLMRSRIPPEEAQEIFNEAYRLLLPIAERQPDHLEAVALTARTMSRLGQIEREAGRSSEGYRISLAGIESLEASLDSHPGDLPARLVLVEMRIEHTRLLQHKKTSALQCLARGLEMAEGVLSDIESENELPRAVRQTARLRLAGLFEQYAGVCEMLGETEKAAFCSERADHARRMLAFRSDESGGQNAGKKTLAF